MPVSEESRYKTISAVLTKEQVRRLENLRELRTTSTNDPGFSEVLREVVEEGLKALSRAGASSFATNVEAGVPA